MVMMWWGTLVFYYLVFTNLYPIWAVMLGLIILKENINVTQGAGIVLRKAVR